MRRAVTTEQAPNGNGPSAAAPGITQDAAIARMRRHLARTLFQVKIAPNPTSSNRARLIVPPTKREALANSSTNVMIEATSRRRGMRCMTIGAMRTRHAKLNTMSAATLS